LNNCEDICEFDVYVDIRKIGSDVLSGIAALR
jgi:hypothetical protein